MTFDQVLAALRQIIQAEYPAVPVHWPHTNATPDFLNPWILFEVQGTGGETSPFGSPGKRVASDRGLIWIHVMMPQGCDPQEGYRIACEASALFRLRRIRAIQCDGPGPPHAGPEDGRVYPVSVSIPFTVHYSA